MTLSSPLLTNAHAHIFPYLYLVQFIEQGPHHFTTLDEKTRNSFSQTPFHSGNRADHGQSSTILKISMKIVMFYSRETTQVTAIPNA